MQRAVVVSGGGSGIGRATAELFARDGDAVTLIGRREGVLEAAAAQIAEVVGGASVTALAADLTDPGQVERTRDEILARFESVDVLVNGAGGNVVLGAGPEAGEGIAGVAWQWLENLRANTLTAALLTEALKPHLSSPGGRVVLISSIAAYRGSGSGSYGGSKAALHPYAYDLASELGGRGVTVNVVAPGYIEDTEFFRGELSAERRRALVDQTLTGRAGRSADVAETIRWLASPSADHVTGQILQVNGGAERGR
jgi:3-oxoacyl-[acyl-carrier protein] reductase